MLHQRRDAPMWSFLAFNGCTHHRGARGIANPHLEQMANFVFVLGTHLAFDCLFLEVRSLSNQSDRFHVHFMDSVFPLTSPSILATIVSPDRS